VFPGESDISIVCAGDEGHFSPEDGDNITKVFQESTHGQAHGAAFSGDLVTCGGLDSHPVLPIHQDRQIIRL
jgi:hypothetical protein